MSDVKRITLIRDIMIAQTTWDSGVYWGDDTEPEDLLDHMWTIAHGGNSSRSGNCRTTPPCPLCRVSLSSKDVKGLFEDLEQYGFIRNQMDFSLKGREFASTFKNNADWKRLLKSLNKRKIPFTMENLFFYHKELLENESFVKPYEKEIIRLQKQLRKLKRNPKV